MLTGQMPSLAQAMAGSMSPAALQQLMQSLGNCQQSLSHRGSTTLAPNLRTQWNGLVRPGTWDPSQYGSLIPSAGSLANVDVAATNGYTSNWQGGNWYDGGTFKFPINADFITNEYYGGDTFNVGGNSYFDNSNHLSLSADDCRVTNLYVTAINGEPVPPPPTAPDPGGGSGGDGGAGPGGAGGGQIGGFPFPGGVSMPGAVGVKAIVTNVRAGKARGKVSKVNTVATPADGLATTVATKNKTYPILTSGSVEVPTVKSATIDLSSTSVNIPTVTSATLSGLKANVSGNVSVPSSASLSGLAATCSVSANIPDTATISGITATSSAVTFAIPTSVALPSFTATAAPINIPTSVSLYYPGADYGSVTIQEVIGGYLDANCTLVLTKQLKTYSVLLPSMLGQLNTSPVTPSVTVAANGSATLGTNNRTVQPTITISNTANASLSASKATTLNGSVSFTNLGQIALTQGSTPISGTVNVTDYGAITLKSGNVTTNLSGGTANVSLTAGSESLSVFASGELTLANVDAVTVKADQELKVNADDVDVEIPIDPALRVKKDFLVYYKPRF